MSFKVDDWVIHDYEIKQVRQVDDKGLVKEVSCGAFSTSGSNLKCRPLTLRNKNIADFMRYYYKEIHNLKGSNSLNFPDIHRYFCTACFEGIDTTSQEELDKVYNRVKSFYYKISDKLSGVDSVDGVRLFR